MIDTIRCKSAPSPKFFINNFTILIFLRGSRFSLLLEVGTSVQKDQLSHDHEERLKDKSCLKAMKGVKVESEYVRNKQHKTNIYRKSPNGLILMDQSILKDIA